jgi:two-component system, chemotaxis family, sensor histidine kinase and response regulator PixL
MQIDSQIRDQAYQFFIQESVEFLQMLEEGLLNLQQEHDTPHIHAIMRAAHSIKGGAASVGLEAIKKIAHQMEDVLRALYKDVEIDTELEELLLQAYDCLRTPLIQQIQTGENDGEEWLRQSEVVFEQLVEKLGDAMLGESELPTAAGIGHRYCPGRV